MTDEARERRLAYYKAWCQSEAGKASKRERNKRYRAAHPEKAAEYYQKYMESHRDELNARRRAWREANKDKAAAYQRAYRARRKAEAEAAKAASVSDPQERN